MNTPRRYFRLKLSLTFGCLQSLGSQVILSLFYFLSPKKCSFCINRTLPSIPKSKVWSKFGSYFIKQSVRWIHLNNVWKWLTAQFNHSILRSMFNLKLHMMSKKHGWPEEKALWMPRSCLDWIFQEKNYPQLIEDQKFVIMTIYSSVHWVFATVKLEE